MMIKRNFLQLYPFLRDQRVQMYDSPVPWILSYTIHVWYIYLNLVDFYGEGIGKY